MEAASSRRNFVISGASGFVGQVLVRSLSSAGHSVFTLVRNQVPAANQILWDPAAGQLNAELLPERPVCINLSGENIAGRWTAEKKKRIQSSRISATTTFAEALLKLPQPPEHFISASAIGYYGDTGDTVADESALLGEGFLAETCSLWENATAPLQTAQIPVSFLRFGVILHPSGGALQQMLPIFRFGLGGKIGSGSQWMSWVTLDDVIAAIEFVAEKRIAGPINVVAPTPVTNYEFTKALGTTLSRPTILPLPAPVARIVIGEFADEALLASARIAPSALMQNNFQFQHPVLQHALHDLLTEQA